MMIMLQLWRIITTSHERVTPTTLLHTCTRRQTIFDANAVCRHSTREHDLRTRSLNRPLVRLSTSPMLIWSIRVTSSHIASSCINAVSLIVLQQLQHWRDTTATTSRSAALLPVASVHRTSPDRRSIEVTNYERGLNSLLKCPLWFVPRLPSPRCLSLSSNRLARMHSPSPTSFTPTSHERGISRCFFRRSGSGSTTSSWVWRSIQSN